jgi:hypothetical protein
MKEKSRHSRGSGNPVLILFNIQTSWMPAFAGMTNTTPSPEAEGQGGGGGNCSSGRCADSVSPASDGVLSLPPSSVSRPQISRNQGSPADTEFYPFRLRPFPVRKSQETKGVRPIRIAEAPKWKSRKGWNGKNRRESPALRVTDNRGEKILVDGGKWMG